MIDSEAQKRTPAAVTNLAADSAFAAGLVTDSPARAAVLGDALPAPTSAAHGRHRSGSGAGCRRHRQDHPRHLILVTGDPSSLYRASTSETDVFAVIETPVPLRSLSRFVIEALERDAH